MQLSNCTQGRRRRTRRRGSWLKPLFIIHLLNFLLLCSSAAAAAAEESRRNAPGGEKQEDCNLVQETLKEKVIRERQEKILVEKRQSEEIAETLDKIVGLCGEVCDTEEAMTPKKIGKYYEIIEKRVNCDNLFKLSLIHI